MSHRGTTAWSFGALLLAAVSIPAATASQAAAMSVDSYIFSGTRISFCGEIVPGDERRFRAIADRMSATSSHSPVRAAMSIQPSLSGGWCVSAAS
jgi:hypothetical protein